MCAHTPAGILIQNYFLSKLKNGILNARIIDIARLAGVSAGTVDRVLHNRGRVSQANREKIEAVLREIGYSPNMAARMLASKKQYSLAVIAPSYDGESYWKLVSEGIEKAAGELKLYNLNVDFLRFDQYDRASFATATARLGDREYDGVIIATLFGEQVRDLSAELDAREVPYVYIDSALEGGNDLAYFGVDSFASGYIAAKLLIRETGPDANLLIAHIKFRTQDISVQMRTREEGLLKYLREVNYRGRISQIEIDPAETAQSLAALERCLRETEGVTGALVLNSRIYELTGLLDKLPPLLRHRVVAAGFEAIAPNVETLRKGSVSFLISQRPELQGYDAVKALGNLLAYGQKPAKVNYMPIDILIPENIGYYNNYKL